MTEAIAPRFEQEAQTASAKIHYYVSMPQPENHLFEVSLQLSNHHAEYLDLKLPVWTPGSYLVREYARHLQNFTARDAGNNPLEWRKASKNYWQVRTKNVGEIRIDYQIFANELTVRTNHLDASHGYFNGAAVFFRIPQLDNQEIYVSIETPKSDWKVSTGLSSVPEQKNTFLATDYDTLVDSPFEVGTHELYHFSVMGKPHELAIWGKGNYHAQKMIADITKIVEVEAKMFDGLPYERYLFLLHLSSSGGGLEHKNSTSLIYQRFGFRDRSKYERFMQLVAHEFFHLWNVKRIRPKALEVFDYDEENYTPSLWFCEGTTSYYDLIIPFRAGIYDVKVYLDNLSKDITRHETTPGRKVQPVAESSFDAWIKLYRQDANSPNSQISYYLKGELVSLLLDLMIRSQHQNQRSLDDVMVKMWEQFGKQEIGYTPEQLQEVIESVAGVGLEDFFNSYIHGTKDLPFNEYLEPFGLELIGNVPEEPYLGIRVKSEAGKEIIKFVEADSPARTAGIDAGDELLAIDGVRVSAIDLQERLREYQPGNRVEFTMFHQDQLCCYSVTLEKPVSTEYRLKPLSNPNSQQQENFRGWLGIPIENLSS